MPFIWRTMMDDRVRPSHAAREGLLFPDNYRPQPGEEYNCRCWKEIVPEEEENGTNIGESDILNYGLMFGKSALMASASSIAMGAIEAKLLPRITDQVELGLLRLNRTTKLFPAIGKISVAGGLASKVLPRLGLIFSAFRVGYGLYKGESVGNIIASEAGYFVGTAFAAPVAKGLMSGAKTVIHRPRVVTEAPKVTRPSTGGFGVRYPETKPPTVPEAPKVTGMVKAVTKGRSKKEYVPDILRYPEGRAPFKLGYNTRLTKRTEKRIETKLQNLEAARSIEDVNAKVGLRSAYYIGKYNNMYPKLQKPFTGDNDPKAEDALKKLARMLKDKDSGKVF